MKTKVYVIKRESEESYKEVVLRTLKMVSLKDIIKPSEKKILINPNWVFDEHSREGNITSTESMEGLIIYLINDANIPPKKIIVADGGQFRSDSDVMKTNDVFRLEEYGISVFNLNADERVDDVKPPSALALKTVSIAKTAMEASCIISVPSLKTHSLARTTLTMKNLMGTILPKGVMHSKIHQKIADLASIFRSQMKFQIIDGIIGSNGFELGGKPIKMDLIIAGEDPVAVDTVGSTIIGRGPDKTKYLTFADEKGLGTANLNEIEVIGSSIKDVYFKF